MDAVESVDSYKLFAAGSCPNVFIVLKTWGWDSYPAGFIGIDPAAEYILRDLNMWGIDTSYVKQSEKYSTPIYVQTIDKNGHSFANQCPFCGEWFRKFQPLVEEDHKHLWSEMPKYADVFYLERVTDYGLQWVKHYRNNGSLIYFEPNRIDHSELFEEIVKNTHIIKYSSERRFHIHEITNRHRPPLEIETHGKEGVQFRVSNHGESSEWTAVAAHIANPFLDACGAGDWFSAYTIHELKNKDGFHTAIEQPNPLQSIFSEAQKWSAKNCAYEGARGLLYQESDIQWGFDFCQYCGRK